MLRDYLKVEKEDQLVEQQSRHDNSQHYSAVTEWVILSKDGQRKGRVSLFDLSPIRRSWSDSFRITQFDNAGKVVVDKLTDAL
ncbi:hypothetical protein [Klebsiella variicola]